MERNEELRLIVDYWFADNSGETMVLVNEMEDRFMVVEDYEWDGMTIHIEDAKIEVDDIIEMDEQLIVGDWLFDVM